MKFDQSDISWVSLETQDAKKAGTDGNVLANVKFWCRDSGKAHFAETFFEKLVLRI